MNYVVCLPPKYQNSTKKHYDRHPKIYKAFKGWITSENYGRKTQFKLQPLSLISVRM